MSKEVAIPPAVLWAQRKENVFLTFEIETKDPVIKFENKSVYFKAINVHNKHHEVTISLYDSIVPEKCSFVNKGRKIEVVLRKEKTDAPYWPSLTSDKQKPHYLKTDFEKWGDEEDDKNEGNNDYDIEEMLRSMGGVGDSGQKPSLNDLESDSDDENLPDLE